MPVKENIPIEGLLKGYETALTQTGYIITTRLLLVRRAELMIRRHLNTGLAYFDQAIINRYTDEMDNKYSKGNMQKKTMNEPNVRLTALSAMSIPEELMLCQVRFREQGRNS